MRPNRYLLAWLLMLPACSWSRFDDLEDNAPIVQLKKPSDQVGFGVSLATATLDDQVQLLVGGSPGVSSAALYSLGTGQNPVRDAVSARFCDQVNNPCFLARSPAALAVARTPAGMDRQLCFAVGIGEASGTGRGLMLRCGDVEYTLDVPDSAQTELVDPVLDEMRDNRLALAADRAREPALVAGAPEPQLAWFYAPMSTTPVELAPPDPPDRSFGTTVASLRVGDQRVFAVGAPAESHVWLFRSRTDDAATLLGCLGGPTGFGRSLASGHVNEDDADDLAIADAVNVTVFDGQSLSELDPAVAPQCSLAALPADTLIASFGCGQMPGVGSCEQSGFGTSLAVGDIDGDGDGEVVVGAPEMRVDDNQRAGAVHVHDVEPPEPHATTEVLYLSSADSDDTLGLALATPWLGDRHIIAAGVPGTGRAALLYCSKLLSTDQQGFRCTPDD